MTDDIILPQCPYCQATSVTVDDREGIIVAGCGCMLTPLQVRRLSGASEREVAEL